MKITYKLNIASGFTLVELLVGLSIAAILISLAVPSFRTLVENNKTQTLTEEIATSLNFARSEALRRARAVTVCPSNDQATCSGTWNDGWIVFVDNDAGRTFSAGVDTLLDVTQGSSQNYTISLNSTITNSFQFSNQGFSAETSKIGTYKVCGPTAESARARGVVIQFSGSTRFAADSNADGIREDHNGDNFAC
jgi:type IV fimbrial biogenesis protein FimT